MAVQRVALIFDDQVRPDTTGIYCRSALNELVEVVHFRPSQLDAIPRRGFDLYLNIDDGLDYALPRDLYPQALWAIDTHLDPQRIIRRARHADAVFAAQRDGVALLRQAGVPCLGWLPLACDPTMHRRHELPKQHDVCFVGHINCRQRAELLELIRTQYPTTFVGQRFFEDMARTYSQSRIVFNCSIRNDLNMRVFESLACGSMLMTNDLTDNGQAKLFTNDVHLVTYRSGRDLLENLTFFLDHPEERERIASAGRNEVLSRHTYRHRMQTLLHHMQALGGNARTPPLLSQVQATADTTTNGINLSPKLRPE